MFDKQQQLNAFHYTIEELAERHRDQGLSSPKGFVFGLDDVIFPSKDYVLQVYYLFANFVEFTATRPPAAQLVDFLQKTYESEGADGIFDKALSAFPEIGPFRENFDRLHHQAQLPLKLLIFPEVSDLLKKLHADGKFIFILTPGDPMMQLNKIRQVNWEGLDKFIKVYFEDELRFEKQDPLRYLMEQHGLEERELVVVKS